MSEEVNKDDANIVVALDQLNLDSSNDNKSNLPLQSQIPPTTSQSQQPQLPLPKMMIPPMMNMNYPYSQMLHMPHQLSFYPLGDENVDSNMVHPNNSNSISGRTNINEGTANTNKTSLVEPTLNFANFDMDTMNPYNISTMPNMVPPLQNLSSINWPNQQFNDNSAIDDSLDSSNFANGIMAGANTLRRQTFHAISAKDLIENSSADIDIANTVNNGTTGATATTKTTNTTTLGVTSNVGAKTRTQSTSLGDRETVFLPPPISLGKPNAGSNANTVATENGNNNGTSVVANKGNNETSNSKDISNTYAAAYPYGGPLLQNNPIMNDGMHFPGNYDFNSPLHGFSPLLGGLTPPHLHHHAQSPIPPHSHLHPPHGMGMSPIPHIDINGNPITDDINLANSNLNGNATVAGANNNANTTTNKGLNGISTMIIGENPNQATTDGEIPMPFNPMLPPNSPHHPHQVPPMFYGNPPFNPMMPHPLMNGQNGNMNNPNLNSRPNNRRNGGNGRYRNNDGRKMEDSPRFIDATLNDYIGNIYSLCKDQHGCRFLQRQLDILGKDAADIIFNETKDHTIELMTDSFGNYLIQKLIERVNLQQRIQLSTIASPHFVEIALNAHGTRALQKLIECISTSEEAEIIVSSLKDSIVELSKDLNGNHVVQKCLQKLNPNDFQFIFDATCLDCMTIATHRHGCCVLQRCLDFGTKEQCNNLCDQLLLYVSKLTLDPFGNYVVQYIINKETERNNFEYTRKIAEILKSKIAELSVHKFGSNVVEKLLRTSIVANILITELLKNGGEEDIQILLNDSYGNYVLQTALDVSHKQNKPLYEQLSNIITPLLVGSIRNTPHGKRIASMLNLAPK